MRIEIGIKKSINHNFLCGIASGSFRGIQIVLEAFRKFVGQMISPRFNVRAALPQTRRNFKLFLKPKHLSLTTNKVWYTKLYPHQQTIAIEF